MKATLAFGEPVNPSAAGAARAAASMTGTIVGYARRGSPAARPPVDLDDTLDAATVSGATSGTEAWASATRASLMPTTTDVRTTVLPRRARDAEGVSRPSLDQRPRFDRLALLGEGGVGTVELARDNDIRRTVAVKKLRTEVRNEGSLLRFADEVRIVGQLEHPNIVPIYDVGRDEAGDVYLVMKHLEGETMEEIIEKLRAGDAAYHARFTPEFRAYLYLSVLDAVRYAHSRGVLHRDLKPANVMIGPFDEVTVMDWGIAKPIGRAESGPLTHPSWLDSQDQRLLETQVGTLAGTPFYMSPEQAAGHNDTLDPRSDVYALSLMFYEWLVLEHPLEGKTNLMEVLAHVITQEYDAGTLMTRSGNASVPCEYMYLILAGLRRDREHRLPTVDTMYDGLKRIIDGNVPVQCPVTLTKRASNVALHWIDRNPRLYVGLFFGTAALMVASLGFGLWSLGRALFGA